MIRANNFKVGDVAKYRGEFVKIIEDLGETIECDMVLTKFKVKNASDCQAIVTEDELERIRVYVASQIFAECWRDYNEKVVQTLEKEFPSLDFYVPQRNKSINDKTKCASAEDICKGDFTYNLDRDDIVIAIVDGDTPGIGTTLEVGYFSRICQEEINKYGFTEKKIISLYTDSRECSHTYLEAKNEKLKEMAECQYSYLNLLLVGCLKRYGVMCRTIEDVVKEMNNLVKENNQVE